MKNAMGSLILTVVGSLILCANVVQAEIAVHTLELGTTVSSIAYKEPGHMKEEGAMLGVAGTYTYHDNVMLMLEGNFEYGQVDYEGRLSNGASITIGNIDDYLAEVRVLGGYDFQLSPEISITPYLGVGYRGLSDNMKSEVVIAWNRESDYFYSPIGFKFFTELSNEWSVEVTAEYDYFWKGIQTSQMINMGVEGYNTLENHQDSGYGLKSSVEIQKGPFAVELFARYWHIGTSDRALLTRYGQSTGRWYREPENKSKEIGIKFSYKF